MSFFDFPHTRTYDSDLGWIIKHLKEVIDAVDSLEAWKAKHEAEYAELKIFYDQLESGNFPPDFVSGLNRWFRNNWSSIIGELVKMVFFGLTDDGYFVAYIPDSWSDIIFNTSGYDIVTPDIDFGHLMLSFNV